MLRMMGYIIRSKSAGFVVVASGRVGSVAAAEALRT
jgi:hypothetical protein